MFEIRVLLSAVAKDIFSSCRYRHRAFQATSKETIERDRNLLWFVKHKFGLKLLHLANDPLLPFYLTSRMLTHLVLVLFVVLIGELKGYRCNLLESAARIAHFLPEQSVKFML